MKKIYLSLLCATALTCGVSLALAQEVPTIDPSHIEQNISEHHKKIKEHHKKIAERLNLTEDQRAKAKELRKNARKKIKPLIDEMKTIRTKMDKIRQENMKDFESILTDEQKKIFQEIREERKIKHEKMMKHHHFKPLPPMPME